MNLWMTLQDAIVEKNPHSKLRLTIPREPELETAQRAQRARFIITVDLITDFWHSKLLMPIGI